MPLSDGDLATLSLLDPDQGVCPNGHACRLDDMVGRSDGATQGALDDLLLPVLMSH